MTNNMLSTTMKIDTMMCDIYGEDVIYTITWSSKFTNNDVATLDIIKTASDVKADDGSIDLTQEEIDELFEYLNNVALSTEESESFVINNDYEFDFELHGENEPKEKQSTEERKKAAFKRAMSIVD